MDFFTIGSTLIIPLSVYSLDSLYDGPGSAFFTVLSVVSVFLFFSFILFFMSISMKGWVDFAPLVGETEVVGWDDLDMGLSMEVGGTLLSLVCFAYTIFLCASINFFFWIFL